MIGFMLVLSNPRYNIPFFITPKQKVVAIIVKVKTNNKSFWYT
jgi:hypothetical protein